MQDLLVASEPDPRFSDLEYIEEMPKNKPMPEAKSQGQPASPLVHIESDLNWVKKVGWALAGIYALIFAGFITWYLPKELPELKEAVKADTTSQIEPIQDRLATVEGKIDALLAIKKIDQVGTLLKNGDALGAVREAQSATASLVTAKNSKAVIPQEYFADSASVISNAVRESEKYPQVADELHKFATQLAEYNSAIQPQPDLTGPKKDLSTSFLTSVGMRVNVRILFGPTIFPVYVHGNLFRLPGEPKLSDNIVVDGPAVFVGEVPDASQTLDGIHWLNGVTFVNMRIRYDGGEVELGNVRFVNCKFEFANNPRSTEFASFLASLGQPVTIRRGSNQPG